MNCAVWYQYNWTNCANGFEQVNKLSLNTSNPNFMVFTHGTYSVCNNGLHLSRVIVTKLLVCEWTLSLIGMIIINIVRNKIAKKMYP